LTVNYGLRYDQVSTVVDESQVSPRVGMVYQIGESTRLHAGYARYFTPPADREDRHDLSAKIPRHDQRAAVGCEHRGCAPSAPTTSMSASRTS